MDSLGNMVDPALLGYIISGMGTLLLGVMSGLAIGKFRRVMQSMGE